MSYLYAGLIILALSSGIAAFLYLGLIALAREKELHARVIADQVWTEARYRKLSSRMPRWPKQMVPPPSQTKPISRDRQSVNQSELTTNQVPRPRSESVGHWGPSKVA